MSKGRGRIERGIMAALQAEPDMAFTTDELCERIYGVAPHAKHRSSVLRAMQRLAARLPDVALETRRGLGSVIYPPRSGAARGMAGAKLAVLAATRPRLHSVARDAVWDVYERSRHEWPTVPLDALRDSPEILAAINEIQIEHNLSFENAQVLLAAYRVIRMQSDRARHALNVA